MDTQDRTYSLKEVNHLFDSYLRARVQEYKVDDCIIFEVRSANDSNRLIETIHLPTL